MCGLPPIRAEDSPKSCPINERNRMQSGQWDTPHLRCSAGCHGFFFWAISHINWKYFSRSLALVTWSRSASGNKRSWIKTCTTTTSIFRFSVTRSQQRKSAVTRSHFCTRKKTWHGERPFPLLWPRNAEPNFAREKWNGFKKIYTLHHCFD